MTSPSQVPLRAVVSLIAISAPLALGLETAIRKLLFVPLLGAELREIREFYWPGLTDEIREATLTHVAWALVGVCVLAGLLGVTLLRRAAPSPSERAHAVIRDRVLLLTSVPQVPAILATLCFSFGAELAPVLACMVVSTAFVIAQGLVGERMLANIDA